MTIRKIEIEKSEFHYSKYPISINNIENNKTKIYKKVSFSKECFKYFICIKDDEKVMLFCLTFPKN